MAVSIAEFATLPDELYQPLLSLLPGKDLKNLRLSCKKLSSLSESFFSEAIVLIPAQECLTGFTSILTASSLGHYIRKLKYDERWIDVLAWLSKRPGCTSEELARNSLMQADFFDKVAHVETEVQLLHAICKLLPKLTVVEVFDKVAHVETEVQLLHAICKLLPKLTVVEVFEHNSYTHTPWNPRGGPMPSYLLSRNMIPIVEIPKLLTLGFKFQHRAEAERSVSNSILRVVSMTGSSVTRLGIHGIGVQLAAAAEQGHGGNAMTSFSQTIDLSRLALLPIVIDWPRCSSAFAQSLANVIITAPNLTELRLSIGEDTYASIPDTMDQSSCCLMTVLGRLQQQFPTL